MAPELLSGAIGAVTAAIITAVALLYTTGRDKRTNRLLTDCRNAMQDMVMLRDLEMVYAEDMSKHVEGTAEAIRLKYRKDHIPDIGDYGQPQKIAKLLKRLEDEGG